MKISPARSTFFEAVAAVLVPLQVFALLPPPVHAAEPVPTAESVKVAERADTPDSGRAAATEPVRAPEPGKKQKPPTPAGPTANRKIPKLTPPPARPHFSASPTDLEIFRARVFEEPLVPAAATSPAENRALAAALNAYLDASAREETGAVEQFLERRPESAWRLSLLTNLGIVARRTGYFAKALDLDRQAWDLGKPSSDVRPKATADRALAELAELYARLGRTEELQALIAEIDGRDLSGSAGERIVEAKQGLALMMTRPEIAFRCGPMAVEKILGVLHPGSSVDVRISETFSTPRGTSLKQMRELSSRVGLKMRMARRLSPDAPILVPAVVHWKAGHFAALVKEADGKYLIQDPTFGDEIWVSREAVNQEASGAFVVGDSNLPTGWVPIGDEEGGSIWGKGAPAGQDPKFQKKKNKKPTKPCLPPRRRRMAEYSFFTMLAALAVEDSPVGYASPVGPTIEFVASYSQREAFQPQIFTYANLGPMWTFEWMGFVTDDPGNPAQTVNVYLRGGGDETYIGYDPATQSYATDFDSRATLVRTQSNPIRYERRLPDGLIEVYSQADGSLSFPRKVFLTALRDPQGNSVQFLYDDFLRLVAVVDAIGQVTTLSYDLPNDNLRITRVTDPFGRSATFDYTPTGRLARITDVIGIQSEFTYETGDFISALTTPYGTTRFVTGQSGADRWIQATDPLGGIEKLLYVNGHSPVYQNSDPASTVPTGFSNSNSGLDQALSLFWDTRAMSLAPGDYSKAEVTHWLWTNGTTQASGIPRAYKQPLENRVWYAYPGQPDPRRLGADSRPITIARVLDDSASQIYRLEWNVADRITKITDPVGRETVYIYGTNNVPDPNPSTGTGLDLLQVKQKNGVSYDLVASSTYNAVHEPLTYTSTAGQQTTLTYNALGQLLTITTPPRSGITENRTMTLSYDPNGYLQSVTGPATGATTTLTYDGYGHPRTVTDSEGYVLTYDYDTLDRIRKVTFPDATYEEVIYNRFEVERSRDRLGRWTQILYDALERPVVSRDAVGRTMSLQWCSCGSLEKLTDANGNPTSWERDIQGRVTKELRVDGSSRQYTYETTTSRLKAVRDGKGQDTEYSYSLDRRLLQVSYPNAQIPTPTVTFAYDPAFARLVTMTDGTGLTSFTYHPIGSTPPLGAGRVATIDGPYSNDTISNGYDELGRVVNQALNGVTGTWSHDALGRLTSQTDPIGTFTYAYLNTTNRLQTLTYPNGQLSSYSYLPNSGDQRLQEIHHKTSTVGTTLSRFTYSYDAVGNIKTWTQQYGAPAANAYDFAYDAADQLNAAIYRTTDPTPIILKRYAYSYDPAGNRTTEQVDDVPTVSVYTNMNRLTSQNGGGTLALKGTLNELAGVTIQGKQALVTTDNRFEGQAAVIPGTNTIAVAATDPSGNTRTNTYHVSVAAAAMSYGYDQNGSLILNGTKTYEWDGQNRLVRVLDNTTEIARFTYDGFGRRATKVAGGLTRTYVYGGEEILEERLSSGGTTRNIHGPGIDHPLASISGGSVSYYLADHLGSIVQTTNSSGTVVLARQYDAYGNLQSGGTVGGYAFTGRDWDPETGLYYYRARYYDPKVGRFLSEDPSGYRSGSNLYEYVWNTPTNYVDHNGREPVLAAAGGLALGGGGAAGVAGTSVAAAPVAVGVAVVAGGFAIGYGIGTAATAVGEALADRLFPPLMNKAKEEREEAAREERDLEKINKKPPTRTPEKYKPDADKVDPEDRVPDPEEDLQNKEATQKEFIKKGYPERIRDLGKAKNKVCPPKS